MKSILQDIVAHTHSLGFLSLVKITNEEQTKIESMTENMHKNISYIIQKYQVCKLCFQKYLLNYLGR